MIKHRTATFLLLSLLIMSFPLHFPGSSSHPPKKNPKANWLRPSLQFLAAMAYGQTRYWIKYSQFIEDWQYHFNWQDQSKRWLTLDAWRFDSNAFTLNWTHALSGFTYYTIARSNGLKQKNSFLFSLAASAYWEYLVEWREVVSINDMIFTPIGGTVLGEIWYRMARSLRNRSSSRSRLMAGLLNPFLIVNPLRRITKQDDGQDWTFNGEVSLNLGGEQRSKTSSWRPTQLVTIDFTIQNGQHPDPFGQFTLQFRFAESELSDVTFFSLVPYNLMSINTKAPPHFTVNWAGGFSFYQQKTVEEYDSSRFKVRLSPEDMLGIPRNYQDKLAIVHLLGPQLHHHVRTGKLNLHSSLSLFADFSLCNALALNRYSRDHDLHDLTSTTFAYGYYYGVGFSAFLDSSIRTKNFIAHTGIAFNRAWTVNWRDRFNEPLRNPSTRDSLFGFWADLAWFPTNWPLGMSLKLEGRQRRGVMDGTKAREATFTLSTGLLIEL